MFKLFQMLRKCFNSCKTCVEIFCSDCEEENPTTSLYFRDKKRHIDFVIVHEEDEVDPNWEYRHVRKNFENALQKAGLELEIEPKENSQDQRSVFIKVHIPWSTRIKHAERMKMKMPLKDDRYSGSQSYVGGRRRTLYDLITYPFMLHNPKLMSKIRTPQNYTAEFSIDKMDFFDIQDEETFFRNSEKSTMAYRIMSETPYGTKRIDIGIERLIQLGVYKAAFPLHEGMYDSKSFALHKDDNLRRILYWEWARWGRWYKDQPIHLIREYFGDKIGIYFAWVGFYTKMLFFPAVIGFIVFLYSISSLYLYSPLLEICDETYPTYVGNLTMCPLCDKECTYWKLKSSCFAAKVSYTFDNETTIFFAILMSLWATMFLELWKRRQFELRYDWDLIDYDEFTHMIRPDYEARATGEKLNRITGQIEPHLTVKDRCSRYIFSIATVVFWIMVIIAAMFAIIVYQVAITAVFAVNVDFSSVGILGIYLTPVMLQSITASLISLIVIMLLGTIYEKVAYYLTEMELPRTQHEFEDSFTLKMFSFQFVNYYSFLFYITFFKISFTGYPGNYTYLFGKWRWNECDPGGCMYELSLQLIIIMFGKQAWNNIVEIIIPWLSGRYKTWKSKKTSVINPSNVYTRWEQDFDLESFQEINLFWEYLELVIQFGFTTLFVAAFPLGPLLALINNIVEIRLDALKFVCVLRRPLAHKSSDIGVWHNLLEFIGTLAVVTNAFTIALTSDTIPKLVYYYAYSNEIYPQRTLQGFTENSLSIFNVSDFVERSAPKIPNPFPGENITQCRYRHYRSPPDSHPKYTLTLQYWHVLTGRLLFAIIMEHIVFFLKEFLDYLIPDRPKRLKEKIKREHFLVQDMLLHAEKEKIKKELATISEDTIGNDADLSPNTVASNETQQSFQTEKSEETKEKNFHDVSIIVTSENGTDWSHKQNTSGNDADLSAKTVASNETQQCFQTEKSEEAKEKNFHDVSIIVTSESGTHWSHKQNSIGNDADLSPNTVASNETQQCFQTEKSEETEEKNFHDVSIIVTSESGTHWSHKQS